MLGRFSFGSVIRAVALIALLGSIAGPRPALAQSGTDLIAAWRVTVEGEARDRAFIVQGVEEKNDGTLGLKGRYGFIDGNRGAVSGEVTLTTEGRKLILTTTAHSVIVATQSGDGIFSGSITYKSGVAKPVRLTRTVDGELNAPRAKTSLSEKVTASREIVVVYWSSADCPYCSRWEGSLGAEGKFRASPEFASLKFYKVKNQNLRGDYDKEHFSPEITWVLERYQQTRKHPGRPGWQVYVDRKLVSTFYGLKSWDEKALPKIKELVGQKPVQ